MILTLQGRISDPPHFIGIKDTKDKVKLEWVTEDTPITRFSLMQIPLGAVHKLCYLEGEGGGKKLTILRRHCLWTLDVCTLIFCIFLSTLESGINVAP